MDPLHCSATIERIRSFPVITGTGRGISLTPPEEPGRNETNLDGPGAVRPANESSAGSCPQCAASASQQFVYSLGRISIRFPTLGIEREFQQRERYAEAGDSKKSHNRWARMADVLAANDHLARAVCFVHSVGGLPAYIVTPSGMRALESLIDAVRHQDREGSWDLLIGRRGPMATPATCAGLLAPMVLCDALYSFTLQEFLSELATRAHPALESAKITNDEFKENARDIFNRITTSTENIGGLDSHRALNYLLVQHPGIFVAAAERGGNAILDSIETRVAEAASSRRVVTVILTFINRSTGVPERLFARVDVTEEWPFLAESNNAGAPVLGLANYIDYGPMGSTL
jgi:hypothetical protein